MYALSEKSSFELTNKGKKKFALSLGIILPFQPCMQEKKSLLLSLEELQEKAFIELYKTLHPTYADILFKRLQMLFSTLNYDSQCKSVAILLVPYEEKLIYLNFSVIPVIYLKKYVTLLELIANICMQPDFYYLVIQQNNATLYEYSHNKLHTVYASKLEMSLNGKANAINLFKKLSYTIKRINNNSEKCVFVSGSRNSIELLGNCYSDPFIFFNLPHTSCEENKKMIEQKVQDIISHWSYWRKKFIIRKMKHFKIKNSLITGLDELLKALSNSKDGLLIFDKDFMKQLHGLQKSDMPSIPKNELTGHLERFLKRGNRIEVMESALVKKLGDVVLLPYEISGFSNLVPVNCVKTHNGSDTF